MNDLFFLISKLVIPLLNPSNWLLLLLAAGMWFHWRHQTKAAAWTAGLTFLLALVIFKLPTGAVLVRPLEQAIRPPSELPSKIDGIITLAGALNPTLTEDYGKPQLGPDAERVTEFVALARAYPDARLVFAGDSGFAAPDKITEAQVMRRFLTGQGVNPDRVVFESKSRTTYESAAYTYALLEPKPGETWILITSASHMPRAHGSFEKSGWKVIPYPVSYLARPVFSFSETDYGTLRIAISEWVGIAAYRISGRM